ncbi:MAG: response regulator [Pseudomonadota bacterium]|nr:response regulator [Pseudomonadota bacterium]
MSVLDPSIATLLIADDDPDDRPAAQEALGNCDPRCVLPFAENGAELLDILNNTSAFVEVPGGPLPGLILLDLNLPKMTGLEALRAIKADSRLCTIPVVVWTTSHAVEDRDASYRDGAAQFLIKPYRFQEIEHVLCKVARTWLKGTG